MHDATIPALNHASNRSIQLATQLQGRHDGGVLSRVPSKLLHELLRLRADAAVLHAQSHERRACDWDSATIREGI